MYCISIPLIKIFSRYRQQTEKGAKVEFTPNSATLNTQGTTFKIHKKGKLYYLNNICSPKIVMHLLEDWHKIMGHCNVDDILKLEENVEGTQITSRNKFKCEICQQAKISQSRNRLPDACATKILEMFPVDLAGPIEPIAKDGFKYLLGCIDDYSGLIVTYMLKNKSIALKAFEKFMADLTH